MPPRFNRTAKARLARFNGPILGNVQRPHTCGQFVLVVAKEPRAARIISVAIRSRDIRQINWFGRGKPLEPAFGVGKFQINCFHWRNLRRMEQVQPNRSGRADHLQPDSFDFRCYAHRPNRHDFETDNLPGRVYCRGQPGGPVEECTTFQQILGFLLQLLFLDEILDGRIDSVNGQLAHEIGNHIVFRPIIRVLVRFGTDVGRFGNPNFVRVLYLGPGRVCGRVVPIRIFVQVIVRHNRPDVRQRAKRVRPLERQAAFRLAQFVVNLLFRVVILLPSNNRQQRLLNVL